MDVLAVLLIALAFYVVVMYVLDEVGAMLPSRPIGRPGQPPGPPPPAPPAPPRPRKATGAAVLQRAGGYASGTGPGWAVTTKYPDSLHVLSGPATMPVQPGKGQGVTDASRYRPRPGPTIGRRR